MDVLQLVLCGDEQATVMLPTPFHPELQVRIIVRRIARMTYNIYI